MRVLLLVLGLALAKPDPAAGTAKKTNSASLASAVKTFKDIQTKVEGAQKSAKGDYDKKAKECKTDHDDTTGRIDKGVSLVDTTSDTIKKEWGNRKVASDEVDAQKAEEQKQLAIKANEEKTWNAFKTKIDGELADASEAKRRISEAHKVVTAMTNKDLVKTLMGVLTEVKTEFEGEVKTLKDERQSRKQQYDDKSKAAGDAATAAGKEQGVQQGNFDKAETSIGTESKNLIDAKTELGDDKTQLSVNTDTCEALKKKFDGEAAFQADEIEMLKQVIAKLEGAERKFLFAQQATQDDDDVDAAAAGAEDESEDGDEMVMDSEGSDSDFGSSYGFLEVRKHKAKVHKLALAPVGEDPLGRVKQRIRDMIEKLDKEGLKDAGHHGECMTAIGKAEKARGFARDTVEALLLQNAQTVKELDEHYVTKTDAEKLKDDSEKDLKQKTDDRQADNKKFVKDEGELSASIDGITEALQIVKEYYGTVADTEGMDGETADYRKQESSGTLVSMVEGLLADFHKEHDLITKAEDEAAKNYVKASRDLKSTIQEAESTINFNTEEIATKSAAFAETNKAVTKHSEVLEDAHGTLEKWAKVCLHSGAVMTGKAGREQAKKLHEKEKKKLEDTIKALNDAKKFLDDAQQKVKL
jgi:hypothetical protein